MIELRPYGLAASLEPHRPLMIFKSLCEKHTVGIPISALEGGILVTQSHQNGSGSSPHGLSLKVLEQLGIRPTRCIIKEVRGHFVYVDVEFDGHEKITCIESRADEALSFCVRAGALFYSTEEMIQNCKELEALSLQGLKGETVINAFGIQRNKHPYLM